MSDYIGLINVLLTVGSIALIMMAAIDLANIYYNE